MARLVLRVLAAASMGALAIVQTRSINNFQFTRRCSGCGGPDCSQPNLDASLPSSQADNQVPSVAGAPACEPMIPKSDSAMAPGFEPKPHVEDLTYSQANERVRSATPASQSSRQPPFPARV
jgi:hypothetical protein